MVRIHEAGRRHMNDGEASVEPGGKAIETRTARLWIGSDGILRSVITKGAEEILEDAQANMEAGLRLAAGREVPMLVDMTGLRSITRPARRYYADPGPEIKYATAMALVGGAPIARAIGNFALGLSSPKIPMKMFANEADALEWLRGFL
jgi:hypothetical protein